MARIYKSRSWLGLALALCTGVPACGSNGAGEPEAADTSGSVALALQVPGQITLDEVQYTIRKGAEFSRSGVIGVADSTVISAIIGGIPADVGYTISLTATDVANPQTICSGAAEFDVSAYIKNSVDVTLLCRIEPTTGSVVVNGNVDVCPTIDAFSIAPIEVQVGGTVQLSAAASDLDDPPEALQYAWSIYRGNGTGTIEGSASTEATLTCTSPGTLYIQFIAWDRACSGGASGYVTCSPASP